ncbi:MAG: Gfo/Idh/MocA family protein [Rubrivivax sp.]
MRRVLILGCGNIAGGFDMHRCPSQPALTHAGAYARDGRFQVVACVEPDASRREAFMQRWSVPQGYASPEELLAACRPGSFEVVSVCAPTGTHAEQVQAALKLAPRLVFCEKPLATSLVQAQAIVQACEDADVPLAVNHSRRWAPDVQRLAVELRSGTWGEVRQATGIYNKGVLNNGSHLVDLLRMLLGELHLVHAGQACTDHALDDPSVPAALESAGGVPIQLCTAHAGDYALFELQLVTSRGVITMEDGGLNWRVRRVTDSPVFSGYRSLDAGSVLPGRYLESMQRAVANLHDHLEHGTSLACTGSDALAAQRLCDRIRREARPASTTPSLLEA